MGKFNSSKQQHLSANQRRDSPGWCVVEAELFQQRTVYYGAVDEYDQGVSDHRRGSLRPRRRQKQLNSFGYPGATPVISASMARRMESCGPWKMQQTAMLHAYDATNSRRNSTTRRRRQMAATRSRRTNTSRRWSRTARSTSAPQQRRVFVFGLNPAANRPDDLRSKKRDGLYARLF